MGTAFAWLGSQVYSGGTPPDPPNLTFLLGLVLIAVAGPVLLRSVRGTPVSEPAGRLLVAGLVALLVIGALESSSGGSPDEPPSTTQPTGAGIVLRQGLPYEGEGGGHWYEVDVLWFTPRTWVTVQCHDSDRQEFLSKTFWIDETGSASDARLCRSREGLDHWVTGGGVESNHVSW